MSIQTISYNGLLFCVFFFGLAALAFSMLTDLLNDQFLLEPYCWSAKAPQAKIKHPTATRKVVRCHSVCRELSRSINI